MHFHFHHFDLADRKQRVQPADQQLENLLLPQCLRDPDHPALLSRNLHDPQVAVNHPVPVFNSGQLLLSA